jgi:Tol biopolymer transport system component
MDFAELVSLNGHKRQAQTARPFIQSTRNDVQAQFSPDGQKIVYMSERSGSSEIWICDREGRQHVQVTAFNRSYVGSPRWSPDGKAIVFFARQASADIYVVNADGGKPNRLTVEESTDIGPTWSGDGQWIYFCSDRSGSPQIWRMPSSGGQATQLTTHGGLDPIESRDRRFLYYARSNVPGIWRVPVEGGEEVPVIDHHPAGAFHRWVLTEKGIWLVTPQKPDEWVVEFFNFASSKLNTIGTLEKRATTISNLEISPDGRWLVWTQLDQSGSDIVLLENFR